jgi:pimeloyl-ACP methyl ester carboxylesterase
MAQSVVLVHGLRTSATMWRAQVEALTGAGHEAIAVDLPGHGTRMGERFTLDAATRTIDDAVARAAFPALVCGLSLGGYTAIHWAGARARPISGLLAASCGTRPLSPVLAAWRFAARGIARLPDHGRALNDAAVRAAVRDSCLVDDVLRGGVALHVMDDALSEMGQVHPIASLSRIEMPVWLVNGTLDHFRFEERRYLRAAPDARLIHVRGATHLVSLTRSEQFTRVLMDALAEVA